MARSADLWWLHTAVSVMLYPVVLVPCRGILPLAVNNRESGSGHENNGHEGKGTRKKTGRSPEHGAWLLCQLPDNACARCQMKAARVSGCIPGPRSKHRRHRSRCRSAAKRHAAPHAVLQRGTASAGDVRGRLQCCPGSGAAGEGAKSPCHAQSSCPV